MAQLGCQNLHMVGLRKCQPSQKSHQRVLRFEEIRSTTQHGHEKNRYHQSRNESLLGYQVLRTRTLWRSASKDHRDQGDI